MRRARTLEAHLIAELALCVDPQGFAIANCDANGSIFDVQVAAYPQAPAGGFRAAIWAAQACWTALGQPTRMMDESRTMGRSRGRFLDVPNGTSRCYEFSPRIPDKE